MASLFLYPQLLGYWPAHSRHCKTLVEGMNDYYKAKDLTSALRNVDLRLATEAGTQKEEAHQGFSYSNWNTGKVRTWEPEGCPGIRSRAGDQSLALSQADRE